MKIIIHLIILTIVLGLSSCEEKKQYSIYWQDNSLCVVLKHPTLGLAGVGVEDWRGVELSDVAEDIYNEFKNTNKSGNVIVWVRFEDPITDKYGNETMDYNDFFIAEIPISEAKKYKSGEYLSREYKLIEGFRKAAFGNINDSTSSQITNLEPSNNIINIAEVPDDEIINSDSLPMGGAAYYNEKND